MKFLSHLKIFLISNSIAYLDKENYPFVKINFCSIRMELDNKKYWVADSVNGFKLGKLVDIGVDSWVIEPLDTPGKTISASPNSVYPCEEYGNKDVDDNCALMYLNEANLLQNIRLRYNKDVIYVSDISFNFTITD